jgi:hypothetical protein
VRLRRTIAVTLLLVLVGTAMSVHWASRGSAVRSAIAQSPHRGTATSTPAASSPADVQDAEDGSAGAVAPSAASVPQTGDGTITVVRVPPVKPTTTGRTVRYTVEVEGGLGADSGEVARTVQAVLLDERGWQKVDGVRFVNVTPEQAARGAKVDIRVTLASPALTDRLCAPMTTLSQVSCWNGTRSVLNFRRWALGDDSYGSDVARYRIYQINHEVGHGLGHGHRTCPAKGARAPVMVQQTLSLEGCTAWPYPSGA